MSIRAAASRANLSEGLWRQIESGERMVRKGIVETVSPKADTKAAVCGALNWTAGSIDLLVAGLKPVALATPATPLVGGDDLRRQVQQLRAAVLLLAEHAQLDLAHVLDGHPARTEADR